MPPEEWPELQVKIPQIMTQAVSLTVPLAVAIHCGSNWQEAK